MILLTGIPSEPPVRLIIAAAEAARIPYLMLNQREMHLCELALKFKESRFSGLLKVQDVEYSLEEFSGIYLRMMDYNYLPEIKDNIFNSLGEQQKYKSILIHHELMQWMAITECRIFNKPSDMLSNLSKPYQAQLIAQSGLKVPSHCITSNQKYLNDFSAGYQNLIFKSISSARSIVKTLDKSNSNQLNKIHFLPTQFQEQLEGQNIRVHVVGDVLFATKITSNVVDYRYASRDNETAELLAAELPLPVQQSCFTLSGSLQLPLCGIDLFLTNAGEYYCFEVNPSPGYSYYQENTGQDIAGAMVRWLEYGTAK